MFIKIPYSASAPHKKLNVFSASDELILSLDIRWAFEDPEAIYTYPLPENADKEDVEANVKNGVLHVRIPKLQTAKIEAEKREIEVK